MQAQMLVSQSASKRLALFINRLRMAKVTTELREHRGKHDPQGATPGGPATVEIFEATQADFEATQLGGRGGGRNDFTRTETPRPAQVG